MNAANTLNPLFEIIGLLALSGSAEKNMEPSVRALREQGVDTEALWRMCEPVHSRYLAAFSKAAPAMEPECAELFFSELDQDFLLLVQMVCAEHPEWFSGSLPEEEAVRLAFAQAVAERAFEQAPSLAELVEILQSGGIAPAACWRLIRLLERPSEWISRLADAVRRSETAYQKALAAVQRQLPGLLEEFARGECLSAALAPDASVQPILVYPMGEIISTGPSQTSGYVGLYIGQAYRMLEQQRASDGELTACLKALGDASKFQILTRLREGAKYNLELAQELELSAATMSHHMSALLTCGLVRMEKREGRVYYNLEQQAMRRLLSALEQRFLT